MNDDPQPCDRGAGCHGVTVEAVGSEWARVVVSLPMVDGDVLETLLTAADEIAAVVVGEIGTMLATGSRGIAERRTAPAPVEVGSGFVGRLH